jgi:hypothetical protein
METTTTTTGSPTDIVGQATGTESSLSNWAGPYVTDMLGKGKALAETPYQSYGGPLSAGTTAPQDAALQGIASLNIPTDNMGGFQQGSFTDEGIAQQYMNPYLQQALNPQLAEMRRQAEITRLGNNSAMTQAGAFGGSRGAIMDSELQDSLLRNMGEVTGSGYRDAYSAGAGQYNTEQALGMANAGQDQQYGMQAYDKQMQFGETQRSIEQQGIDAQKAQFDEENLFPYKQVQYMQSLLQGMPLGAQTTQYAAPSDLSTILGQSGGLTSLYDDLFGSSTPATTTPAGTFTAQDAADLFVS